MSRLTAELLGLRVRSRSPWRDRFAVVSDRLVEEYGVPTLGNFRNPVKEIFYILLSAKTADAQYRVTHRRLLERFPTLTNLAKARIPSVKKCIETGGLAATRAKHIIRLAKMLIAAGGKNPARFLRSLDSRAAFEFLLSLPGVGPKSAFCVMMYSLDWDVFPMDANVQRIAARMGAIPYGLNHVEGQRELARLTPDGRSRELHIVLVVHGRVTCVPRNPKCERCPVIDLCAFGKKRKRTGKLSSVI